MWIQTATGRRFDLVNPHPSMVFFDDIAAALSKICRFTGHVKAFYSVAQHSVLVSRLVPEHLRLQALLHDAAEAYVGDVSWPLKQLLPEYKRIEHKVWTVVADRFGLPHTLDPLVKRADTIALLMERRNLMQVGAEPLRWAPEFEELMPEVPDKHVFALNHNVAHNLFVARFDEILERTRA